MLLGSIVHAQENDDPATRSLLERLASSADLYREHALEFACEEAIRWSGRARKHSFGYTAGHESFGYVFVYDQEDGFEDYRTRLKRGSRKKPPRRVTPEEFNVPRYLNSPYLWIFTFKRSRWAQHTYELAGEETILDRKAVKIEFTPVLPIDPKVNGWYGTAWVDAATARLLKVDAYTPDDQGRLEEMRRHAEGDAVNAWIYDVERVTTWFETEIDGLRFPSRVEIRRVNYTVEPGQDGWQTRPDRMLQVDQIYRRYEFFGVRTRDEQGPVVGAEH